MADIIRFPKKHSSSASTAQLLRDLADAIESEDPNTVSTNGIIVLVPTGEGKIEVIVPNNMTVGRLDEILWEAWRSGKAH